MEIVSNINSLSRFWLIPLLSLLILLSFTSKGESQTPISTVTVGVQYSNFSAVPNLILSLKDDSTGFTLWCLTTTTGQCTFTNVIPGTYRLTTELNSSYLFADGATYRSESSLIYVLRSLPGYNSTLDTLFLNPITISQYPRILTFQVVPNTTSGPITSGSSITTPIQGADLFFSNPNGRKVYANTDYSGIVRVGFPTTDTTSYTFTISREGYRPAVFNVSQANQPSFSYVGLQSTNAYLTVTLVDNFGNSRPVGSTESGWISCYSRNGLGGSYSKSLMTGQANATLPIGDGSYRCGTSISGYPSYFFDTEILPGDAKTASVPIIMPDSYVTISFQTSDGISYAVQSPDKYVFCSSDDGTYSQSYPIPIGASYVDIAVVEGTYSCRADLPNVTTSETEIEAVSGYSTEGTIVVTIPNATLTTSLFDSATLLPIVAQAINQVQISCYESTTQQNYFKYFKQGESTISLGVTNGKYSCMVQFPGYKSGSFTAEVATGATANHSVTMERLTSYIDFNLKDSSGSPFVTPTLGNSWAQISCTDLPGRSKWYYASLRPGETTARVNLVPGFYSCSIISELFSSDELKLNVAPSTPLSTDISIIQFSTKVAFTLRNQDGLLATPPNSSSASIHCSEPGGRSLDVPISPNSSTAERNFGEGDYTCSLTGAGISSEQFDLYLTGYETIVQVDVEVVTGDSVLTVDLFNPDTQQPALIGSGQYGELSCWAPGDGFNRFSNRYETNTAVTTVYLPMGTYDCSVYISGFASDHFRVTTQTGKTTSKRVSVVAPNSYIHTNLLSGNTDQAFAIPEGTSGYLNCRVDQREAQGIFFSTQVNAGDTEATLGVREGTYLCSLWLPEYGSSQFTATTTSGATIETYTRIYPESNIVTVKIVDKGTGLVVDGVPIKISAYTRNRRKSNDWLQHWQEVSTDNGSAELHLVGDQDYEINVRIDDSLDGSSSASGSPSLVLSNNLIPLRTAASGTPQTVTIEAIQTTTFVEVSLLYPDGTPVSRGWAEIATVPSSADEVPEWDGERIVNGKAKIAAIPGKNYEVAAHPAIEGKTQWIQQKPELVMLTAGETRKVTLRLSKPDYELNVNMELKGTAPAGTPSVFCYTVDNSNRQSFSEADAKLSAVLPLNLGSDTNSVEISCSAHYPDISNEYGATFYGNTTFVPSAGTTAGTVKVELSEYGRYYSQEAYTFDAAFGASFTLQDGSTQIEIPAKAVASSGTATMYVGSATGYSFEKGNFPLLSFEINFQVDGNRVSDMTLPITLRFPVDDALLAKLGGSVDKLKAGSFEDGSRIWKEDASYSYDTTTKMLSVSVTHFTIWGLLVDLLARIKTSQPPAPTPTETPVVTEPSSPPPGATPTPGATSPLVPYNLRAKLVKKGNKLKEAGIAKEKYSYKICWKAPPGLSSTATYELQMLLTPKSTKGRKKELPTSSSNANWNKAKITKSKTTCLSKNLSPGTAYARVRMNGGDFSDSISFRVGRK